MVDTRLVRQKTITLTPEGSIAIAWALACDGVISLHCVRARKTGLPSFVPLVVVSSTDKELVQRIRDYADFGYIYNVAQKGNNRDYWRWTITRTDECLQILEQVRRYLPIKQKQANLVIEACKIRLDRTKIGWNQFKGSVRQGYGRECEIYEAVTTLNRRHKTVGRKGVVG